MSKESKVEEKMSAAYALLDQEDAEGALAIGIELEGMRHSSGFEIQALARARMGDLPAAIETLERGVEKAPRVWSLWQLLGNNYSEEERYEDAIRSYERALVCPAVQTRSVHYNLATALSRQERTEAALAHLDLAHLDDGDNDPKLERLVSSLRINLLARVGRVDESLRDARKLITKARVEGTLDDSMAPVLGAYASALWTGLGDRDAAEEAAWEAIGLVKDQQSAMWTLRDMSPKASSTGSFYRVLLTGTWWEPIEEGGDPPGFYTNSWAIADSPEEAFALVSRFEPPEIRSALRMAECEALDPRPGEPKGVYSTSGYIFFSETDSDD
jgi:tetratricopeptide (TPR) repeat protein